MFQFMTGNNDSRDSGTEVLEVSLSKKCLHKEKQEIFAGLKVSAFTHSFVL